MASDFSSIYKEKIWGKDENGEHIIDGYVFRGKRTFKKVREDLEKLMQKGYKGEKDDIKYRVLDSRIKGVELEIEIEIIHKNEKGIAMLKLYGPNKKKENVVSVTRSKGNDYKFTKILAENVIKPLMNGFLMGQSVKDKSNASELNFEENSLKCQYCDKTLRSKAGLKGHITKMHQNKTKEDESDESLAVVTMKNTCSPNQKEKTYTHKNCE